MVDSIATALQNVARIQRPATLDEVSLQLEWGPCQPTTFQAFIQESYRLLCNYGVRNLDWWTQAKMSDPASHSVMREVLAEIAVLVRWGESRQQSAPAVGLARHVPCRMRAAPRGSPLSASVVYF